MPRYEDLKFIRDRVLSFGNEAMIRKNNGESLKVNDLPPEIIPESNPALDDIDSLLEDITDDLNEGLGYTEPENTDSDSVPDIDSMTLDDMDEFKLADDLSDITSLDDIDIPNNAGLADIDDSQWDDFSDGSFNDLENMTIDDDVPNSADDSLDSLDPNMIDLGDMSDTDNNADTASDTDIPVDNADDIADTANDDIFNNDDIFGNDTTETDTDGQADFDLGSIDLDGIDETVGSDDIMSDQDSDAFSQNEAADETSLSDDDSINANTDTDIDDMLSGGSDESGIDLDMDSLTGIDDILNDDSSMDADLDTTFGDEDSSSDELNAFNPNEFNLDDDDAGSMGGISDTDSNPSDAMDDMFSSGMTSDDSDPFSIGGLGGSDDELGSMGGDDTEYNSDDSDSLLNGIGFGEDADDSQFAGSNSDDDMGLSLDDINNEENDFDLFDDQTTDDGQTDGIDDIPDDAETMDSDAAHKETSDKVEVGQDGSINLTDAQRKQIIMSLSVMPKEAELKIAQQIVSGSFSDEQLKPLINALVNKEKVVNVLRIYEKVTGDTSLAGVRTKKMSGQDFNEQKKSLSYQFKKNILPIISRLALVMIVLLSLIALYVRVIDPTFRASHYYKVGKQNIVENKFDNVEPYFEEAYKLQPRYGQVLDYARLYRDAKRYKAAEIKYDNAYRLKPSKPLSMEMADFYREMKDYGTAAKRYEELKTLDDKDEEVLIGLGRTHLDWADSDRSHLETAKSIFQDVIDMNVRNKDAVFYMADIAIKEGNDREVMKFYNYIDKNLTPNKVEDKYLNGYLDMADFMIDTKRYDEARNILDKTGKNPKTKLMPRQEYTQSKLKKGLNVIDEERVHLNNVLKIFDYMKAAYPLEYNTRESMTLLSDTYNALGENADRFSRGSIEAEQNYIKATQINPLNGKAFYNLGNYELNYKATKSALESARLNLQNAERLGWTNDRLNFNLGWIAYKQHDYKESFRRINPLAGRYSDNSNLRLFIGTVCYQMGNYDYAEAYLKENFDHFTNLKQVRYPLDMELSEDRQIAEMLVNCANNLGAVYHKKYERTRKTRNRDMAAKCYEDSMEYYDKLKESKDMYLYEVQAAKTVDAREVKLRQLQVTYANQNLRNILYPAGNSYEPIIFEEFPLQYESSM